MNKNVDCYERIWGYISQHPGCTMAQIKQGIGSKSGSSLDSTLACMESKGYLLTEDTQGRLYAFDVRVWDRNNVMALLGA